MANDPTRRSDEDSENIAGTTDEEIAGIGDDDEFDDDEDDDAELDDEDEDAGEETA